ncbi:MAG: nickel pincer cofactor biosynthesis protein LarB [Ktedonobacterales bacterium]|nr:nickel pincer cofactor biosynthesis protein LarB [Ktedonobacterales bacterium]
MAHGNETITHRDGAQSLPATALDRPDLDRATRRGIPEVILADSKSADQVIAIARQFLASTGRALISRLPDAMLPQVVAALPEAESLRFPLSHALRLTLPGTPPPTSGGHIGIITAGTSDIPYADEARFIAEAMGCQVTCIFDVGVAGVHRLFDPLNALITNGADVAIVAAGMDGALPSLVAGLVPFPVIGLPTPIGYGMGGQGEGALLAMLQSCSPGLVVVNIGNGIGAGAVAALIANRVATVRHASPSDATAAPFVEVATN